VQFFLTVAITFLGTHGRLSADDEQEYRQLLSRVKEMSVKTPRENIELIDRLEILSARRSAGNPRALFHGRKAIGHFLSAAGIFATLGGQYADSASMYTRALNIFVANSGPESEDVADCLLKLAENYHSWSHESDAATTALRALSLLEKLKGTEDLRVSECLVMLGNVYHALGRYAEAEAQHKRALAIREKVLGPEHPGVAASLNNLATVCWKQGRFAVAEHLYKRSLAIREKALGPDHTDVAASLNNMGVLYNDQGRYAEAEPVQKRALAIREKALGPDHPDLAGSLSNVAIVYECQGRYAEAEPLYKQALFIEEKALGPDHPGFAAGLHNLAGVCAYQGRYAEAGSLYKRALTILEKALGPDHADLARGLQGLAIVCTAQGRNAQAEPLIKRALAIQEKALGPDHPAVASTLNSSANVYIEQDRYAEVEPLYRRALAIRERALGLDHCDVAQSVHNLGYLYCKQGQYSKAEPLFKRALAMFEKAHGPDHPDVASSLHSLGSLHHKQGRDDLAEPLLDRAIAIRDRAGVAPGVRFSSYGLRAQITWKTGRRDEAIADLHHALELAEQQRGRASGAEHERAESFTQFARAFERMVAWQTEMGNAGEAYQAIERAHARSLLDEIGVAGADLTIGRTIAEREQLRQREGELRSQIAGLEKQAGLAKDADAKAKLQAETAAARAALYEHFRDERSSSPVYRNLLSTGSGPPRLSQLQRGLPAGGLLLAYLLGEEDSFVLVLSSQAARVVKLAVPKAEAEAKALALKAGSITADQLKTVLIGAKDEGIVPQLADSSAQAEGQAAKLAALWRVLVPEPERKAIVEGKVKHLLIVPDGPLALLPFETLVVAEGKEPRFLLDVGPPIAYGPSATVLYNLAQRTDFKPSDREPVLAVGDPAYGEAGAESPTPTTTLAALTSRSRYSGVGGRLSRLPYSGAEVRSVVKDYSEAGISAASLGGATATERGVRYWSPGRKVLHLACHGLADQQFGNFFGALALTPGPRGAVNPADDGFLTLPEIYELNLKGCELAILSACQTNYGPQQKGEGTWALSRGFLVAGSRRVVASNWLVDDEAAASLVHSFCAGLARAEKEGKVVDHAAALQAAKRYVRRQEKWKSPYYWASMVLIGPP
jgi:CHAT domain-containing protein/Tfp pilus assembly protein PilF